MDRRMSVLEAKSKLAGLVRLAGDQGCGRIMSEVSNAISRAVVHMLTHELQTCAAAFPNIPEHPQLGSIDDIG